nr:hypothetical protein [uncultured Mediterranean phage uvMED]
MAYIGKTPITGNFVKLDAISVVNGQAGYTMNNGGSAFTDYENVNQFLVSLNGILQAPTDSFTVSGSTLTFASNLATGDVIDFVIVLGNTLDIGTPSDATVTQAKTNFVSTSSSAGLQIKGDNTTAGTLQLNCEQNSHGIKLRSPSHSASASYTLTFPTTDGNANEFLQSNGSGVLTWAEAGGTFNKIATADYSSGATSFTYTDCFTSTYALYKVYVYDITIATDINNEIRAYFQNSSNADVNGWTDTAVYGYISDSGGSAGTGGEAGGVSDYIRIGHSDFDETANEVSAIEMTIYQPYESTNTIVSYNCQLRADNTHFYSIYGGSRHASTSSLENLKFQTSAGANFQSYKSVIYGIKR